MNRINYSILFFIFVSLNVNSLFAEPIAKVTIKVKAENGDPIVNGRVTVYFHIENNTVTRHKRGLTDSEGFFTVSGKTGPNWVATVKKEGYYESGKGYPFSKKQNYLFYKRWLPWNPTIEIVLREKRNPVKMYAKGTGYIKVPVQNQPVGYDLVEGDWVEPYGKGKIKDFIINFNSEDRGIDDWRAEYTLSFSNKGDGMQVYEPDPMIQSEFKLPYEAPVEGYLIKKLNKYARYFNEFDPKKDAMNTNIKRKRTYIFRVRTETSENGNVTGGMYGLMSRDIIATSDGEVDIGYALNPSNRSLEYGGNLFEESDY
jgi:hypothetical protein